MKGLKSIWVRVLAPILCTISSLGLAISILLVVSYSEMGGTDNVYRNVYEDIADNYALYALDMVEQGEAEDLKTYLDEREIACTITKQLVGEGYTILPESQAVVFSTGEVRENVLHQIELVEDAGYNYDIDSLMSVFYGYGGYTHYGETTSAEVSGIVFDKEMGYFYYETDERFYKIEDIVIYQNGVYMDYSLTKVDGVECYYNGYYKQKLEPAQYEMWYSVEIDDKKFDLATQKGFADAIYVTNTSEIEAKGVGTHVVYANRYYVEYYPTDYVSTYTIQIDWKEGMPSVNSLFTEWYTLYNDIMGLESLVLPCIIGSFILLILSVVLLMVSTINEKEEMGLLHKSPVAIYTGVIFLAEAGLFALLVEGIPAVLMHYGRNAIDVGIVLGLLTADVMIWLAIIWLQNIVTRLKCKSFWRTTELYYTYKIIRDSWGYVIKACKWCWNIVTKPFKAVGKAFGKILHGVGVNTPLFWGGLLIFGAISLVELYAAMEIGRYGDAALFLGIKVVEVVALIIVLFDMKELHEGGKRVASGDMSQPIDIECMYWKFREHGENINKVSDGIALAVEERMKSERFKTELITNVSHDIKTPLTSIINYVDLIKKEEIQDEKLLEYVDVLDRQSARLKKLIEDLMEASKASTGNLTVNLEECDIEVLLTQVIGEFEERLEKNQLEVVVDKPDHPVKMMADGRHMWRVLDNLLNNACKYSLPGSRVYVSLKQGANEVVITFKNISKSALNIPSDELMERFVRGDSSRNTEGSGLGLSIAQSLTELMKGSMKLDIDGDLFKVTLRFPMMGSK